MGGEVAVAVGEYLKRLSRRTQTFCITHLAVLAARADRHYKVEKSVKAARTVTRATLLNADERVGELARMLSGDTGSASITHALALRKTYGGG
jgi:DNA repair protein RecN (Recombination protein N)